MALRWAANPDANKWWFRWLKGWFEKKAPIDPASRHILRVRIFRIIAIANILLGVYYFHYRYTDSVNPYALWIALPLLLAETYSFIDTLLFMFMMWQPRQRVAPDPAPDLTVDVFITTHSEQVELVRQTAEAALKITYPHNTFILDDGNRLEMRAMCQEIGCGYITRDPNLWQNMPRHAKAGNLINALLRPDPDNPMQAMTTGEFILILDADQIPNSEILDKTLGFFDDQRVAFVQTPQYFYNVSPEDPFGSQAPLFYGPIQQGKDGWNAAFFCGSNAILRREALMQLGLVTFVQETEKNLKENLSGLPLDIRRRQRQLPRKQRQVAEKISAAAETAVVALKNEYPVAEVMDSFHKVITAAQQEIILESLDRVKQDLLVIEALKPGNGDVETDFDEIRQKMAEGMLKLESKNLGLEEIIAQAQLNIDEAFIVKPLITFSITEDMATAMRLHALGWKSVFFPKIMVRGLAPEDLVTTLGQRLRWAAGTIQVLLRDNPLLRQGLSWPQRLQYFTTMYSYFSGFVSLIYLLAPVIYLLTGIAPVVSYAGEFLWRIIPYLLMNKIMFKYVSWGIDVRRGEQYSLAMFPLWIQAVVSVFGGKKLKFQVTSKTRQSGVYLNLVIPQLAAVILLIIGCCYALLGLGIGWRHDGLGVWINTFWAGYDIWMLSAILKAAVYRPKK